MSFNDLLSKIRLHLKVDWISDPAPPAAAGAAAGSAILVIPAREKLQALLELGAIGYIKGIVGKLDEIEQQDPVYQPFTRELRELVKRFRLNDYSARLQALLHQAGEQPAQRVDSA